jgi:hypothetical protein
MRPRYVPRTRGAWRKNYFEAAVLGQQEPVAGQHFFFAEAQPERAAREKMAARARVNAFFMMMRVSTFFLFSSILLLGGALAGCATRPPRADAVDDYTAFLHTHPGADLQGRPEQEAIERFKAFLSSFTEEKLRRDTGRVYAKNAFLNDTLKTVRGSDAIEEYFLGTVGNTESITVAFTDVARSGNEYYFRWVMDVRFKKFQRGKTIRTIGMTHVRFNKDGQVILHQDYWDSAQGFFEYVPVVGGGIRFIKSKL